MPPSVKPATAATPPGHDSNNKTTVYETNTTIIIPQSGGYRLNNDSFFDDVVNGKRFTNNTNPIMSTTTTAAATTTTSTTTTTAATTNHGRTRSKTMIEVTSYSRGAGGFGCECDLIQPSSNSKQKLWGESSSTRKKRSKTTTNRTSTVSATSSNSSCSSSSSSSGTTNGSRYYLDVIAQGDKKRKIIAHALRSVYKKLLKGRRKDKDSPTPPTPEEQKEYLEDPNTKERISDADFFKLVALPPSLDINEWMATHTISLFNHVNLIYGVVSQYCTPDTCPAMTAPDNVQYFWYDDKGKKSKSTACQYIDYVMSHIEQLVNDESVFPTKFGHPFPPDVEAVIKRIHKYLFQVLAHIYHAHYRLLHQLGLHAHLNTLFTHFMVFTSKFDLIQDKDSDILLHLFSLLLKNLADPSQNPQLREELEGKAAAQKEKQKQYETSGEGESGDDAQDNNGAIPTSSNPYIKNQENCTDSCLGDEADHCDSSSKDYSFSSLSSSEKSERNGSIHSQPTSILSSSRPSSNSTTTSTSPSSTLIPSSDNNMRRGRGDSDGSKPPTDWLGGMQISAT